uniref:CCHC-type domain-containing protein n=1 Tax=Anopheles stephensi TaxID=30069 RepID=A0A182YRB3_ANOST
MSAQRTKKCRRRPLLFTADQQKPADIDQFLQPFVDELNFLIYTELERTDHGFRLRIYEGHHKYCTPLLKLNNFDIIKQIIVADQLHLIDLGITKRTIFEENARLLGWTELHKLVYAKRLLTGPAKLFISSANSMNSWKQLKDALAAEFSDETKSVDVHEAMRKTKKKCIDELYTEYVYAMQALAKKREVDEESICEYIVQGIDDDPRNKVCLIGASSLAELKIQLKKYQAMKSQLPNESFGKSSVAVKDITRKCYKCGKWGHLSNNCNTKDVVLKCYNCGLPGHEAKTCRNTARTKCYRCGQNGHKANECGRKPVPGVTSNLIVDGEEPT